MGGVSGWHLLAVCLVELLNLELKVTKVAISQLQIRQWKPPVIRGHVLQADSANSANLASFKQNTPSLIMESMW